MKSRYSSNDTLYLGLYDVDDRQPFADITVNLPGSSAGSSVQYVDTNNFPELTSLIDHYDLGSKVGSGSCGYCEYPLYRFNMDKIRPYLYIDR